MRIRTYENAPQRITDHEQTLIWAALTRYSGVFTRGPALDTANNPTAEQERA
jgi:hypothetical protein